MRVCMYTCVDIMLMTMNFNIRLNILCLLLHANTRRNNDMAAIEYNYMNKK